MILTDKEQYLTLARAHNLVPVARRVPADTETPVSTYLKTARGPWSFLLESVEGGTQWGRYSMVGFDPFLVLRCEEGKATVRGEWVEDREGDPLDTIREVLDENNIASVEGLPRFFGGLVGYIGYGAARFFEDLPKMGDDPTGLPDMHFFAPRKILAFDNVQKTLDIIALTRPGEDPTAAFDKALAEIDVIYRRLRVGLWETDAFPPASQPVEINPVISREKFEEMVLSARESIHAGDAIQVVVSQPFEGDGTLNPFTVYRALRGLNPSPYMFHLAMDEEVLVGASPEVMVRVDDGKGIVRPIAGTRHRGKTPAEDIALGEELLADKKERAEHVMLVDLGRNDLGRVAVPGGVTLEESFSIERYSHVMHIVSTVSADLKADVDVLDVLGATFPAGTVSGAPKVRAMELIDELEGRERGFYAGAVGYLGFDGNMDTCIAIRTILFYRGKIILQAGAGIVADSDPAFEYEETLHKARALRRALEVAAAGLNS
jgi:anthranilate synthase component 1